MTAEQFHVEQEELAKLIAAFDGNRYSATMCLADGARTLLDRYNNQLLESEAITWLLTGDRPTHLRETPKRRKRYNWRKAWATDRLSDVLDTEVKTAVIQTLRESMKYEDLEFCYCAIMDVERQARVRILSRIIWTAIQQEEY